MLPEALSFSPAFCTVRRGHDCARQYRRAWLRVDLRNGHVFKSWPQLAHELAHAIRAQSAVLDGEICCVDSDGRSNVRDLLFRREWPYFYSFDLLMLTEKTCGR